MNEWMNERGTCLTSGRNSCSSRILLERPGWSWLFCPRKHESLQLYFSVFAEDIVSLPTISFASLFCLLTIYYIYPPNFPSFELRIAVCVPFSFISNMRSRHDISHSTDIHVPIDIVWKYLIDLDDWKQWNRWTLLNIKQKSDDKENVLTKPCRV